MSSKFEGFNNVRSCFETVILDTGLMSTTNDSKLSHQLEDICFHAPK